MFKSPTYKESHRRSVTRSTVWRIIGILFLALITYIFTQSWITTTLVTIAHHSISIVGYYLHERFWLHIKWLKYSKYKPFARVFVYEVIYGNLILGTISFIFTGNFIVATAVTLTYICNKYWMFYLYDWIWNKVKWGTTGTIVYAYVAFDLFHIGHLKALEQAKALGDYLIVGVITDEGIEAYKRQPIQSLDERMKLVAGLGCVDKVIEQKALDPTEELKKIQPDILVHGDDWNKNFPGASYMRSIGKQVILTKYYHGQSTTKIIDRIRNECIYTKIQRH